MNISLLSTLLLTQKCVFPEKSKIRKKYGSCKRMKFLKIKKSFNVDEIWKRIKSMIRMIISDHSPK